MAVPLAVATLVLTVAIGSALADVGGRSVRRVEAQSAADAAALAGVTGGRSAAVSIAQANGATMVHWSSGGGRVEVVVAVEGVSARASATDLP